MDPYRYAENNDIKIRLNMPQASAQVQYQLVWHDDEDTWRSTIYQSADVDNEDNALEKVDSWLESNSQS